jgi:H/ACA ribonucleoprotein complex non-core subunit NAF1
LYGFFSPHVFYILLLILYFGWSLQVFSKQVIVEATDHKLVLNEGSILWLTDQRIPLGLVDEVFGPVKKPYYVVRYNEVVDIPEGAIQGKDVAFVSELANFVQDDPELWKKGYDASGEHDEELSEVEFSDDEKEEEMKRAAKKRSHLVQGTGSSGRRGGRGGQAGSGDRSGGWRRRGQRGCGRGRDFRTESPETVI